MDKFGIFKLLSAFSNFGGNVLKPPQEERQSVKTETPVDKADTPQKTQTVFIPLQSQMLGTMKSHDEFVTRVMKNNKEKP